MDRMLRMIGWDIMPFHGALAAQNSEATVKVYPNAIGFVGSMEKNPVSDRYRRFHFLG